MTVRCFISEYRRLFIFGALFYGAGVYALYQYLPERAQHFDIDSGGYHAAALRKIETGVFEKDGKPILHPLGYPAFLALVYRVCGDSVPWVVAIQALLAFLTIMAITSTAYRWYGKNAALYTFVLAAANIGFYIFPQVLLVEVLQLFCIAWAWERFVYFLQTKSKLSLGVSGLLAGLSLIFKPSALHFPLVIMLAFFVFSKDKKEFLKKYASSILFFMFVFYIPVVATMVRNWWYWGYCKYSYLVEENLFNYFHYQLLKSIYGYDDAIIWNYLGTLADTSVVRFKVEYWQNLIEAFRALVLVNWVNVIIICIQNIIKNCFGLYTRTFAILVDPSLQMQLLSFFKMQIIITHFNQYISSSSLLVTTVTLYEIVYSFIRWMLIIFGLYVVKRDALYALVVLSSSYFLGMLCMYGNGRYRFVQEPLLLVFAAQALYLLAMQVHLGVQNFKKRKIV